MIFISKNDSVQTHPPKKKGVSGYQLFYTDLKKWTKKFEKGGNRPNGGVFLSDYQIPSFMPKHFRPVCSHFKSQGPSLILNIDKIGI